MIERFIRALRRNGVVCALALAAVAAMPAAHAESTQIAFGQMYGGALTSDTALNMIGSDQLPAGKLTVQVNDLGVPFTIVDRLKSLSFDITNSSGIFAAHMGDGVLVVDLPAPDFYTLHIRAVPADEFRLGLLTWSASFEPLTTVPLPASFWLLIAGAAWAIGLQRKRAKLASKVSSSSLLWGAGHAPAY